MIRGSETMNGLNFHKLTFALGLTLFLALGVQEARAGCSRFGHSCFGAHGKRAEGNSGAGNEWAAGAGADLAAAYPLPSRPESYPAGNGADVRRVFNPSRISPYLLEWAMAAQRASEMRQALHEQSKEDGIDKRRK